MRQSFGLNFCLVDRDFCFIVSSLVTEIDGKVSETKKRIKWYEGGNILLRLTDFHMKNGTCVINKFC